MNIEKMNVIESVGRMTAELPPALQFVFAGMAQTGSEIFKAGYEAGKKEAEDKKAG